MLDPRRHAYRADLAAESLRGQVEAEKFTAGETRQVVVPSAPLRSRPDARESWTTECLLGEQVTTYEERDGWCWVQLEHDQYVGYIRASALTKAPGTPTHRVSALGTSLYAAPDMKTPPLAHLSMNAMLSVAQVGYPFMKLADGRFVPSTHVVGRKHCEPDFVDVAEKFIGVPYVWGGKTRLGVDCSGLVQLALQASGVACPRDSDMQQTEIGEALPTIDLQALRRGDIVFWKGHVGIMLDSVRFLHANAHHMAVAVETLAEATSRITGTGLIVTAVKRLAQP
jgi:cell wall-associated NlpC family hydrolase